MPLTPQIVEYSNTTLFGTEESEYTHVYVGDGFIPVGRRVFLSTGFARGDNPQTGWGYSLLFINSDRTLTVLDDGHVIDTTSIASVKFALVEGAIYYHGFCQTEGNTADTTFGGKITFSETAASHTVYTNHGVVSNGTDATATHWFGTGARRVHAISVNGIAYFASDGSGQSNLKVCTLDCETGTFSKSEPLVSVIGGVAPTWGPGGWIWITPDGDCLLWYAGDRGAISGSNFVAKIAFILDDGTFDLALTLGPVFVSGTGGYPASLEPPGPLSSGADSLDASYNGATLLSSTTPETGVNNTAGDTELFPIDGLPSVDKFYTEAFRVVEPGNVYRIDELPDPSDGVPPILREFTPSGPTGAWVPETELLPPTLSDWDDLFDDTPGASFWSGLWRCSTEATRFVIWQPNVSSAPLHIYNGRLEVPWLRWRQRDDIHRMGRVPSNAPTSRQRGIRKGLWNTYW